MILDYLNGFNLKWLAAQVKQPNGQIGMPYQTFYSYVASKRTPPHYLVNELRRITGREIKL